MTLRRELAAVRYEAAVTDAIGRERTVIVEVSPGRVGLVGPPGDAFGMDPDQCDTLAYILRAAADNARGYRASGP
jgi:hypothetical protein